MAGNLFGKKIKQIIQSHTSTSSASLQQQRHGESRRKLYSKLCVIVCAILCAFGLKNSQGYRRPAGYCSCRGAIFFICSSSAFSPTSSSSSLYTAHFEIARRKVLKSKPAGQSFAQSPCRHSHDLQLSVRGAQRWWVMTVLQRANVIKRWCQLDLVNIRPTAIANKIYFS